MCSESYIFLQQHVPELEEKKEIFLQNIIFLKQHKNILAFFIQQNPIYKLFVWKLQRKTYIKVDLLVLSFKHTFKNLFF